ncbi:MAG: M48 family metalloprotease, partial [Desulfobacterales bacterium]
PIDELKAVMAHEMAHARYKHLLFYILFFLGFAVCRACSRRSTAGLTSPGNARRRPASRSRLACTSL